VKGTSHGKVNTTLEVFKPQVAIPQPSSEKKKVPTHTTKTKADKKSPKKVVLQSITKDLSENNTNNDVHLLEKFDKSLIFFCFIIAFAMLILLIIKRYNNGEGCCGYCVDDSKKNRNNYINIDQNDHDRGIGSVTWGKDGHQVMQTCYDPYTGETIYTNSAEHRRNDGSSSSSSYGYGANKYDSPALII